ncbi:nucleotidyltransferase family protein [bacterium]|nr:nucleotidyltransferase family protein [bacterium]
MLRLCEAVFCRITYGLCLKIITVGREKVCALILVAGLSKRMGDFKPLMALRGRTVIENTISSALEGGVDKVVLVTGCHAEEVEDIVYRSFGDKVECVRNEEYASSDMIHSIKIGVRALPECGAFFLLPGDMPVVSSLTFRKLLEARRKNKFSVIFPSLDGYRKHPPLIDSSLISEIISFSGKGGLRMLWKLHEGDVSVVDVDDAGVWVDLDTSDDYQKCRETYEN